MGDALVPQRKQQATYESIRRSYPAAKIEKDKIHTPYSYFVLGGLSARLAPVLVNMGFTANAVTAVGHGTLLLALTCILCGAISHWFFLAGAVLLHVVLICDNIDGHVARFNAQASRFGVLFDALAAWLHYSLLPVCLGLALCFGEPEPSVLALGIDIEGWFWVAVGVVRMFSMLLTAVVGIEVKALMDGRDYEDRGVNATGLILVRLVLEGEPLLLGVTALLGVVAFLHTGYALVYLATLGASVAMNLRFLRRTDREARLEQPGGPW